MKMSIQHLHAACQAQDKSSAAQTLAELVQQQHPESPLLPRQRRQFTYCCTCLVDKATDGDNYTRLLLAAEVCFNYAYVIHGQKRAKCCPHHPQPAAEVSGALN